MRHRRGLVLGLAVALYAAAPAPAQDVARLKLGSIVDQLIAAPDGGAWVTISQVGKRGSTIGRASSDGRFMTMRVRGALGTGALGPDGHAWFTTTEHGLVRAGADGAVTRVPTARRISGPLAAGADGTLWAPAGERIARVSVQGSVTFAPLGVRACDFGAGLFAAIERASDGAMWVADIGCERLIRIARTGTTTTAVAGADITALAADAAGGMWFAAGAGDAGHVTAAGVVTRHPIAGRDTPVDAAVAPDGSAWFALGTCRLARIAPSGEVTTTRAPVPAVQLAFDQGGGLWLASRTRLVRFTPGTPAGTCDGRPPALRFLPRGRRISIAALRRSGLAVAVREPALVIPTASFAGPSRGFESGQFSRRVIADRRGGTTRYRIRAAALRRLRRDLAAGRRWTVTVFAAALDAEGNVGTARRQFRVTR